MITHRHAGGGVVLFGLAIAGYFGGTILVALGISVATGGVVLCLLPKR